MAADAGGGVGGPAARWRQEPDTIRGSVKIYCVDLIGVCIVEVKVVATNNKARFNYELLEKYEAGIVLQGPEVKSIRNSHISLAEAFVGPAADSLHLYLFNANISKYKDASYNNHEPRRPRILLLHKAQRAKLIGAVAKKGLTIVPLSMYFNQRGLLKISIALARGKSLVDKRATIMERQWNREKSRILKTRHVYP